MPELLAQKDQMLRVEDAFIGAFGDRLQVFVSSVLGNSLFLAGSFM